MAKKSRRVGAPTARATSASKGAGESRQPTAGTAAERAARRAQANASSRRNDRKRQYEKQQKQWFYTKIGIAAVVLVLLGGIGYGGYNQYEQWRVSKDVKTYFGTAQFAGVHIDNEPLLYEEIPPVGGPHKGVPLWQNCGFYAGYIANESGVHSLEHGAVWITYDPNLPQDQKDKLKSMTDQQYVLVSAYPGMDSPVIATVWGKQIKLDGANDSRLDAFVREYRAKPDNTPEPGGLCWSGVSATTDVIPQQEPYIRADPNGPPVGGITLTDATATAAAGQPGASPEAPPTTPAATPAGSPVPDTPGGTPVASPVAYVPVTRAD